MATSDELIYPDDEVACIAFESARIASERLTPERLEQLKRQIKDRIVANGVHKYLAEWLWIIDHHPERVRELFLDKGEHARYMRSLIPFRAFVTSEERSEIHKRIREAAGSRSGGGR